eukprot:1010848-Pyramimonas_sp.AAC.1
MRSAVLGGGPFSRPVARRLGGPFVARPVAREAMGRAIRGPPRRPRHLSYFQGVSRCPPGRETRTRG